MHAQGYNWLDPAFTKTHKPCHSVRRFFLSFHLEKELYHAPESTEGNICRIQYWEEMLLKDYSKQPSLTVSGVTYHSERRHSMLDLKPSQAPSIKPPHMGWKRLSKELLLGFNENQMLWAQLSCFLSRTTEQPLLQFHQEPCPSFPSAPALLRVPSQNQIKSSRSKLAGVLPKYCNLH